MQGVSTTTMESFLDTTFTTGITQMLYVLQTIWPYLITVAVLFIFWRVGRSFFR